MVTTIQVDESTKEELLRYAAKIQARTGRRIDLNTTIRLLLQKAAGIEEARTIFARFFGSLKGEKGVWEESGELRVRERQKVERKARPS